MGQLRIGRVVLENASFELTRTVEGITLVGMVETGLDFTEGSEWALAARDDLKGHETEQDVIAVTWDGLYDIEGYYRVGSVEFQTKTGHGNYAFTIGLLNVVEGTSSPNDVVMQSRFAGTTTGVVTNDFGITTAAEPIHAPPFNHTGYDPGTTVPASMVRALSSGYSLKVYRDVAVGSHPKWSCEPEDFYIGAVSIRRLT